jgi:hypothetical protein
MRLLTLTTDEIFRWLDQLERESKALKAELLSFCWYMRGGLTYSEAMELSTEERQLIAKLIKDNMETTKKSGLPFF